MKKRLCCLLLIAVFCLTSFACTALAAPSRDIVRADRDIDPGMRMLLETVLGAAVYTGVSGVEENMTPPAALIEEAFALGLFSLSLPHDGQDVMQNTPHLSGGEMQKLYSLLFASGAYALPEQASAEGITRDGDGLTFDLTGFDHVPRVGVHVYSVAVNEGPEDDGMDTEVEQVELLADLCTYYGDSGSDVTELPEEELTWLCHGEIVVDTAPDTAYGYRIRHFALSAPYEDGMTSEWQEIENTVCEYSVNLPSIFGLAQEDPAHMIWQTSDGSAEVRIDVESTQGQKADALLAQWLQTHGNREIVNRSEFDFYYSMGEGVFDLWQIHEDLPEYYHLTMVFPEERQDEYGLYSEFIRNSLVAWRISNG